MPEQLQQILSMCTPFGSRVWGGATDLSNYDYAVKSGNFSAIKALLEDADIEYTASRSLYFQADYRIEFINANKQYNFTILKKKYEANYLSTISIITKYVDTTGIKLLLKSTRNSLTADLMHFFTGGKYLSKETSARLRPHFPELFI